jgi:hypothetical protein
MLPRKQIGDDTGLVDDNFNFQSKAGIAFSVNDKMICTFRMLEPIGNLTEPIMVGIQNLKR